MKGQFSEMLLRKEKKMKTHTKERFARLHRIFTRAPQINFGSQNGRHITCSSKNLFVGLWVFNRKCLTRPLHVHGIPEVKTRWTRPTTVCPRTAMLDFSSCDADTARTIAFNLSLLIRRWPLDLPLRLRLSYRNGGDSSKPTVGTMALLCHRHIYARRTQLVPRVQNVLPVSPPHGSARMQSPCGPRALQWLLLLGRE